MKIDILGGRLSLPLFTDQLLISTCHLRVESAGRAGTSWRPPRALTLIYVSSIRRTWNRPQHQVELGLQLRDSNGLVA